jgi:hypothetical protein
MQPAGRLVFVHDNKGGTEVLDRLLMTHIAHSMSDGAEISES